MRGLRHIITHFSKLKTAIFAGATMALALSVLGGVQQQAFAADIVRNCDNNAIMYCGAATPAEFKQKFVENKPGDLPAIYGHYWIPQDLQVVQGQAYRDGTIRVNGKVVANNAKSIGRQPLQGSRPISIAGKTYYETPNNTAFNSDGLPTMVALDAKGNFKYAVISGCGNPVYATPVVPEQPKTVTPPAPTPAPTPVKPQETPKYACTYLNAENLTDLKKRFTMRSSTSGGATAVGYRVDFGDGSSEEVTGSSVSHTYTKAGSYTVRATAKFTVNGSTVESTSDSCVTTVTTKEEEPCIYDSNLPKDSPNCVAPAAPATTTPTEMPKTGAGSLIASGLGLGTLLVSGSFYMASRRDLLSSFLSR